MKCLPKLAIFSRLCLARSTKSLPLDRRWFRIARKSSSGPRFRLAGRLRVVMRYRWNKSVPAERDIGFAIEAFRAAVWRSRSSSVSATVDTELCAIASTRASMAATGMVSSGSSLSMRRYDATMSNSEFVLISAVCWAWFCIVALPTNFWRGRAFQSCQAFSPTNHRASSPTRQYRAPGEIKTLLLAKLNPLSGLRDFLVYESEHLQEQ